MSFHRSEPSSEFFGIGQIVGSIDLELDWFDRPQLDNLRCRTLGKGLNLTANPRVLFPQECLGLIRFGVRVRESSYCQNLQCLVTSMDHRPVDPLEASLVETRLSVHSTSGKCC